MENTKDTDPQNRSKTSEPASRPRPPAPAGLGKTPPTDPNTTDKTQQAWAKTGDARVSRHDAQITKLSADLAQQRSEHKSAELSLITRIADVDDDRRHADTRLQRSLQTQGEELDARLRRQGSGFLAALIFLLALLVGTAVFFYYKLDTYAEFNATQQKLVREVASLERALDRMRTQVPEIAIQDKVVQERLSQLYAEMKSIAEAVDQFNKEPPSVPAAALDTHSPTTSDPKEMDEARQQPAENSQPAAKALNPGTAIPGNAIAANETDRSTPPDAPGLGGLLPENDAATQSQTATTLTEALPEIGASAPPREAATLNDALPADTGESTSPPEAATSDQPLTQTSEAARDPGDTATPTTAEAPSSTREDSPQSDPAPTAGGTNLVETPESPSSPGQVQLGDKPYVMQLIGFYTFDSLLEFASQFELPSPVYYRRESYRGRPWFVLIHSLHPTRESANEALSTLPDALSGLDIWVRKLEPETMLMTLDTMRDETKPVIRDPETGSP